MGLLFLFVVYAAGSNIWVQCSSTCGTSKCTSTGTACCKSNEKLNIDGVDKCCTNNNWVPPSSDICDGLDNDCNTATADGSGETAPNCALQSGVCAGSKKSCGAASGWLTCTSANYGPNYDSTESRCSDGLDNDCDGVTDCADTNCAGLAGPGGVTCCQTVSNCVNDDCKIESCASNVCSYTNRLAGATDECSTCQACDTAGGNCVAATGPDGKNCVDDCTSCVSGSCTNRPQGATDECATCQACNAGGNCAVQNANEGKNCVGSCSYCNAGTCTNRPPGAIDECSTCQACNAAGGTCAGITAETGKNCNADCFDCSAGSCTPKTEINDGACNDDCTSCVSGSCTNRNQCAGNECAAGQFCDAAGGNCQNPDSSSPVCLNCAPDTTPQTWTAINHQDAGKGFGANLFNSNAGPCLPPSGGSCFDANNNPVNHKSALTTSTCCGDDTNEFFKPDFFGAECTADVNDCVWSTGDAQSSNTGNANWWCFQHEWNECKDSTIGVKVGGVTCAGTAGTQKWTPNSLVKTENQYSCSDSLDNDGDGKIDCADSDCGTTVSGFVREEGSSPIFPSRVDVLKNGVLEFTDSSDASGFYTIDSGCGTYDMVASATDYISSTVSNINFPAGGSITQDFTLFLGTSCEADCTYAGDSTIHQECEGVNGCNFCSAGCSSPSCTASIAQQSCNLAQPGWDRLYDDPSQPECVNGCVIACQESCPEAKIDTKAIVTCDEGENLIKATKLVMYKGKLLKLNVVVCG